MIAILLALAGDSSPLFRPLYPVGARPGRWFPIEVLAPATVRTDSGTGSWRVATAGADAPERAAVFVASGDGAVQGEPVGGEVESHVLPPAPPTPLALAIGAEPEEVRALEERGWTVHAVEPASAALDPFLLDVFDLVVVGEEAAPRIAPSAVEALSRCLQAGVPIGAGPAARRALFGEAPPPGLLEPAPPAREKEGPLSIRPGAARPSPLAFARLRSPAGALLLIPFAVLILVSSVPRRLGVRGRTALLGAGGIAASVLAASVPCSEGGEISVVRLDLPGGGSRLERIVFPSAADPPLFLPPGAVAWPARAQGDRVEVERVAGGKTLRIRGVARIGGAGSTAVEGFDFDGMEAADPFGALGAGCFFKEGRLLGATPPFGSGERFAVPSGDPARRLSRPIRAFLDALEPPAGLAFLATLPPPRGEDLASFLLVRFGGD